MVQNPPEGFPRITPYLLYEDFGQHVRDVALEDMI